MPLSDPYEELQGESLKYWAPWQLSNLSFTITIESDTGDLVATIAASTPNGQIAYKPRYGNDISPSGAAGCALTECAERLSETRDRNPAMTRKQVIEHVLQTWWWELQPEG